MKKIFIAFGAGILTTAALFAGKPSTAVHTIYYTLAGSCKSFSVSTATLDFTTGGVGSQAAIITSSHGLLIPLWGACSLGVGTIPVFFHL